VNARAARLIRAEHRLVGAPIRFLKRHWNVTPWRRRSTIYCIGRAALQKEHCHV
jgi:hypothetical protein